MIPVTQEEKDTSPAVSVTYRRAAKIGEDYTTIELGVVVPAEASDEMIAQAVATGDRACVVLRDEVEAQITQVLARANAPTQEQWRKIEQLLEGLSVPSEDYDDALALLGGRPTTRRKAEECARQLAALRRNLSCRTRQGGHNGNGNSKNGNGHKPVGWRWSKEAAQQGDASQTANVQGDTPAAVTDAQPAPTAETLEVIAAKAFKLSFGPHSHPDWKGKNLGDIAALPEGPKFLEFLKDTFAPTTPDGEKLKAHAITLINSTIKSTDAAANQEHSSIQNEEAN